MIQAVIGGTTIWLFFRYVVKREDFEVDFFGAFAMFLVPALLAFLTGLAISFFKLPAPLAMISYLYFFAVPFLMLNGGLSVPLARAAKYSGVVLGVAIGIDVLVSVAVAVLTA